MTVRALTPSPRCLALEIAHFAKLCGIDDPAEAFGLDAAAITDPEAMVPVAVYYDALEQAAARCGDPHFGVRFALYFLEASRSGLGAMQFLFMSAPSLRLAYDRIVRYQRYWNRAEWYDLVEGNGAYRIRYRCWGPPRPAHVHQAEKTAVFIVLVARAIDPGCKPLAVAFPHARRGDDGKLERTLGVEPSWGAPWTEVTLPRAIMDRSLPSAHAPLFQFVDRWIRRELAELPADDESFSARVYAAVRGLLHERPLGQDAIARAMQCGARTLARRLADEGTSVRQIIEAVRRERAGVLLEANVSIKEVASLLGYSEPAAFQHAFRRWHAMSPKAWLAARHPRTAASPRELELAGMASRRR